MAKGDDIQECGELCKVMGVSAEVSSKAQEKMLQPA